MNERIQEKIAEIEKYLKELEQIIPPTFDDYKNSIGHKAACERYFEKIAEAVADVALLIIKDKKLMLPEEEKEAFDLLATSNIIKQNLANRLKDAKAMRNFLSHQYDKIDDSKVYHAITEQLFSDVTEFLGAISER